jgi:hypothetical protein
MKFEFALWTRVIIAELIRKHFGITLSESSIGRLLRQVVINFQKPLSNQENNNAVEQWKKKVFPHIRKKARKVGAIIYFENESGIWPDIKDGSTWALKNQSRVTHVPGTGVSLNMIGAISQRGEVRFMVVKGSISSDQICEFLHRLMLMLPSRFF